MSEVSLSCGQELFIFGAKGTNMFFLMTAGATYYAGVSGGKGQALQGGEYICEMVLWMSWEHRGLLAAGSPCEIITVDSELFGIFASQSNAFISCRQYARLYLQRLLADVGEHRDTKLLSDLWGDFDVKQDISQRAFGACSVQKN